jgi:putative flippase GtrA
MVDTLQVQIKSREARWPCLSSVRRSTTASQLARYGVVGGLAFVVDFFTFYAFTAWVHVYYLTSAAIAFVFGLTCNYLLSRVWVFDRRTLQNGFLEFAVFAVIGLFGLGLTQASMWFLKGKLHLHYLLAKIATTAFVFLWNFIVRKYSLFR